MKKALVLSIVASVALMAADNIGTVTVEDVTERLERTGALRDVIVKTEVVTAKEIQKKQATNLAEAIKNEAGIQVATGCSMCGMKRVRINGMKGEHTTVLIDDVPMHSTVSSYYGLDALATAGVSSIDIARGAGASLIAPGAIGGVINVKSLKATKDSLFIDMAGGNDDYKALSAVGTAVSEDKKTRATVSMQKTTQGQWDADDNGVNESPEMENKSISVRLSHDLTDNDNVDFRYTTQSSNVFGGPVTDDHNGAIMDDSSRGVSFVGGDVRNNYTGNKLDTLEAIDTDREEYILRWTHEINSESNFVATASYAKQIQDSIYEGDTYYSDDDTYYADFRYNNMLTDEHFLTVGADMKNEEMDSTQNVSLNEDDFKMQSFGAYIQDTWTPTDNLEIAAAIRLDHIEVDWTDQAGTEIDKTIVVPRLHIKYDHGNGFASRASAGQGYRAPLTFFESEHGVLGPNGFDIDITDIEKSNSADYSLSYDSGRTTATASINWTQIENLAYIDDETTDTPTLKNATETMNVVVSDIVAGYQLTPEFSIGASYEYFHYDDEYKAAQFLAEIEQRAKLMLDYESNGWAANMTAVWVGSRDLSEYGYEGYNIWDGDTASSLKDTDAPAYYTVDFKVSKDINKNFTLYAGVQNLFDYTQAGEGDSPLFYDDAGEYDVGFIYGPLRGRQMYAGLQAKF